MLREQEFYESVRENIEGNLPPGYEGASVELTRQIHNNDSERTGITIRREGESVCPVIYLDSYYREYENGADMDMVVNQILDVRTGIDRGMADELDPHRLTDYDAVRPNLQMRVFDTEKNEKKLEGIVHHSFGDFSAGYSILLGDQSERSMSVMVTPSMMDMWGITKKQLHEDTIQADLGRGPVFTDMENILPGLMGDGSCRNYFHDDALPDPDMLLGQLFILTSASQVNGAGLILNPQVQEKIADLMDGDYYVLPSSVHEVLILPDNGSYSAKDLSVMVHDINSSMVSPEEVLSDKVQLFDSKSKTLVNALEHEREQERAFPKLQAKCI